VPPSGDEWLYETKWNSYRGQLHHPSGKDHRLLPQGVHSKGEGTLLADVHVLRAGGGRCRGQVSQANHSASKLSTEKTTLLSEIAGLPELAVFAVRREQFARKEITHDLTVPAHQHHYDRHGYRRDTVDHH
jgi:hypothetical protein